MSEEVNQEQEVVSEVTPGTPTINLDSTIQVDGEEVSVQDLLNSRQENLDLKQYNEQAKMLINPNAGDNESKTNAIRFLMSKEGYSDSDINEYIQWTSEAAQEEPEQQMPQNYETESEQQYQIDPETAQYYEERARMENQDRQRVQNLEERQSRISSEMMKKEMNSSLDVSFETNQEMKKLLNFNGDVTSERSNMLKQEVESAMLEGLRNRRSRGENFDKSWFNEEAGKAVKSVYDKFSSVIGDPDLIQRSPETAATEELFNKPPVKAPMYEKGDDMGSINNKTREWTLDTLLRGAREDGAGGKSKT
jgi:hypothetical protein